MKIALRNILFCLLCGTTVVKAQAPCNCAENFEFVFPKIKNNYAGWKDKTMVDPTGFDQFTTQQGQKAQSETEKNECYKIIQNWLSYFRDHHTHLYAHDVPDTLNEKVTSNRTELKSINKSTLYFRLPTFNHQEKNVIDSLIESNLDQILETPYLILDVRNNGGGSDITYAGLIQFLYTNKITIVNNSIWSSEDNIQKFKNILNDSAYPESGKGYIRNLVVRLEKNPKTFVKKEDYVIRNKAVLAEPKKIIVLIDRGCASSCEEFVLLVRQSKKVTLMGENTMGALDYANVHHLELPFPEWGLQYATSRSNRLPKFPIDNIGIAPSVKIAANENWVVFAAKWLNKIY